MYGLNVLESWLYDDELPFVYLKYNEAFEFLKKQIGTSYFTDMYRESDSDIVPDMQLIYMAARDG